MGYTKLFNEILASTIWDNEWYVKVTWITILAMKDDRHQVMASIPGLAHMARVSVEQCQEAINKFCSPDAYSRSQEQEGRRLQPIDGGWYVINGPKYSHRLSIEDKREYQRIWIKNKRLEEKIEKIESRQKSTVDNVDDVETTEHNITEHNITEHKKKNTLSTNPEVLDVFLAYCKSWGRNEKTYLLTPDRIKMIKMAISLYGRDGALKGVENFRNDPFEKRSDFCDIKYLFGKQDRIDKFCQPQAKSSKIINVAQKKHQEGIDRIAIVNQMLDQRFEK